MPDLNLADIQGIILRGYNMPLVRHFVLRVNDATGARRFIGELVDDGNGPQVTTAAAWGPVKPDYALNLGFIYAGLQALRVAAESLASFPAEFVVGAVAQAALVGDTGDSAPSQWKAGLGTADAHVLLSLFAQGDAALEVVSATLCQAFKRDGALTELGHLDGRDLPESRVHFGYVDSLSQPNIDGAPATKTADQQPVAPTGEFLMGYPSQHPGLTYNLSPCELGFNGSFSAFRVLQQDVDGFERFLQTGAAVTGLTVEHVAAKLCGRWRNGVPLALSPDADAPDPPLARDEINDFDYVPSATHPDAYDDTRGYRCPAGAHMRRNNPRGERVLGDGAHLHRIMRRGIPYGPAYDPAQPNDGLERGLLGHFICVSLKDQYEFLMTQWVNGDIFAPGLSGTRDPLLGDNSPDCGQFIIPDPDNPHQPHHLQGFSRFITTRGGAYCFLPGINALRYLAQPLAES